MRYVAAYLLATLGGNKNPAAKDIKGILESVGIEADDDKLEKVISELNGKDINEVIEAGKTKLAGIPSGAAGGAAAAASGGAGEAAAAEEEKKEEKKESESESDEDMGFGLFD